MNLNFWCLPPSADSFPPTRTRRYISPKIQRHKTENNIDTDTPYKMNRTDFTCTCRFSHRSAHGRNAKLVTGWTQSYALSGIIECSVTGSLTLILRPYIFIFLFPSSLFRERERVKRSDCCLSASICRPLRDEG